MPVLLKLHINMITQYNIIVTRFSCSGAKKGPLRVLKRSICNAYAFGRLQRNLAARSLIAVTTMNPISIAALCPTCIHTSIAARAPISDAQAKSSL